MADQAKNILIGVFVITATAIMIFVLMFLHPTVGDDGRVLRVRFSDIDKVNIGTRVTLAGKPVGEVTEIREVEFGREGKADASGHLYLYELDLSVDSSVHVFDTDIISLMTSGLLGERNIEITPLAPKRGQIPRNVDKEVIYAQAAASIEETLAELKEIGKKIGNTLDTIQSAISKVQDEKVIERIAKTAQNLSEITTAINKPEKLSEIVDNIHTFFSSGKIIFEDVSSGKGFIGRAIRDDDLYLRLVSILSKGETIFNDINHYGLFFNTDKRWQRLRARRLNLLEKLRTPQEFRNYFNDEIDMITTSLSRVAMLMEICNPACCDILENSEFSKVFAELLRRVSMMEDTLKMYNIQAVGVEVEKTELLDFPCRMD